MLAAVWMTPAAAQAGDGDGGLVGGLAGAVSNPVTDPLTDTVGTVTGSAAGSVAGSVGHATSHPLAHPATKPDASPLTGSGRRPVKVADPVALPHHTAPQPPPPAGHDSGTPRSGRGAAKRGAGTSSATASGQPRIHHARTGEETASYAVSRQAALAQQPQVTGTASSVAANPCWVPGLPEAYLQRCLQGYGLPNLGGPDLILLPIGLALVGVGLTVVLRNRRARA